MRRTILTTIIVLALSMAVCTLVQVNVNRVVHHARHLRTEAIIAMDEGQVQTAEERMVELAQFISGNDSWLSMVCDHTDLHEIKADIIDAQAAIEFGIEDDFYQAVYRFGEGLEHIGEIQEVSLRNLY